MLILFTTFYIILYKILNYILRNTKYKENIFEIYRSLSCLKLSSYSIYLIINNLKYYNVDYIIKESSLLTNGYSFLSFLKHSTKLIFITRDTLSCL